MAAPTTAACVKKTLANPEPSTHGPQPRWRSLAAGYLTLAPGNEDTGSTQMAARTRAGINFVAHYACPLTKSGRAEGAVADRNGATDRHSYRAAFNSHSSAPPAMATSKASASSITIPGGRGAFLSRARRAAPRL
jgi:hypothetical protein